MVTLHVTQWLRSLLVMALGLMLLQPVPASADQAQYIYDDLGRLVQVIDGQGNVATYNYDAVGNLLSITRSTGGVGTPTVTGITPNTGAAGAAVTGIGVGRALASTWERRCCSARIPGAIRTTITTPVPWSSTA